MKKYILTVGFYLTVLFAEAQVTDFDGNVYDTVLIGNQIWLKQNIKSLHYSDGTLINPSGVLDYNNDPALGNIYGKLYKWSALSRGQTNEPIQGICPNGYRIAHDGDWSILGYYLGGDAGAGRKLKDTILWQLPNAADNSTGFSALPGGKWDQATGFNQLLYATWFWTGGSNASYFRYLTNINPSLYTYSTFSGLNDDIAHYCRCVKDYQVSLDSKETERIVSIFPSPVSDLVSINFTYINKEIKIQLCDLLGREIKSKVIYKTTNAEFDVIDVTNGVYVLKIIIEGQTINRKIIVQH
jgi:uncharacterized protein (TIGR02145 family)